MATDSEILGDLVSDLADGAHFRDRNGYVVQASDEEIATLRKYAAIARVLESGEWKLVPATVDRNMLIAWWTSDGSEPESISGLLTDGDLAVLQRDYSAVLAAATQFQEE